MKKAFITRGVQVRRLISSTFSEGDEHSIVNPDHRYRFFVATVPPYSQVHILVLAIESNFQEDLCTRPGCGVQQGICIVCVFTQIIRVQ